MKYRTESMKKLDFLNTCRRMHQILLLAIPTINRTETGRYSVRHGYYIDYLILNKLQIKQGV